MDSVRSALKTGGGGGPTDGTVRREASGEVGRLLDIEEKDTVLERHDNGGFTESSLTVSTSMGFSKQGVSEEYERCWGYL